MLMMFKLKAEEQCFRYLLSLSECSDKCARQSQGTKRNLSVKKNPFTPNWQMSLNDKTY